ncbi:GNAT family N-acetyltransferase [Pedobacter caeni]|uniref:Acetyltransferase (GNAT) domain-containing protein n=1 Tax=Pedobacter caeni TaxID=288992 RepID=A0A1M5K0S7_9SPHI|nr:GNAT family N-acetyltransferase [Pedobacter caeni]SHG46388.1 Acetyltransferase (GNAT) domain-containing protein [Pedobacter caeni]
MSAKENMDPAEWIVINNMFEFWDFVGRQSKTLLTKADFKAILVKGSDWPKRIFNLGMEQQAEPSVFKKLADEIQAGNLPNMITFTESLAARYQEALSAAGFSPRMKQLGMMIDLSDAVFNEESPSVIHFEEVETEDQAALFAVIAASSFNYHVGPEVVASLINRKDRVRLFIAFHEKQAAACGLIFYDEQGHAGLHMIGTLPEARGKGLAKKLTTHLLQECIHDGKKLCVLHASQAGEYVYVKLGFTAVKDMITYHITT